VDRLRRLLSGTGAVARELPEGDWPSYHRAIALGLSGDVGAASTAFAELIEPPHDQSWVAERASRCVELQGLLLTPAAFRDAVTELIRQQRHALRLPIVSQPLPVF
jgi:hypothetical protein